MWLSKYRTSKPLFYLHSLYSLILRVLVHIFMFSFHFSMTVHLLARKQYVTTLDFAYVKRSRSNGVTVAPCVAKFHLPAEWNVPHDTRVFDNVLSAGMCVLLSGHILWLAPPNHPSVFFLAQCKRNCYKLMLGRVGVP